MRALCRRPGQSLSAILAFALAIGLTTAAFSIAWGSLYRSLPFPGADRLVRLQTADPSGAPEVGVRLRDYLAWRGRADSLEGVAAWYAVGTRVTGDGDYPERYNAAYVSPGFFRLVGVEPRLGRALGARADAAGFDAGAVISHRLWVTRFDRDPHVLGREVEVWNRPFPIVGVMPPGFRFPLNHDLWVSLGALLQKVPDDLEGRLPVQVLGKLRPGGTRREARTELDLIRGRTEAESPSPTGPSRVLVSPFELGYNRGAERPLHLLLLAGFVVFLIACANVANLHLGWAASRSQALAVRGALGATRLRIVALVLLESLLTAAPGALVGIGIAWIAIQLYDRTGGLVPSYWVDVGLQPAVLLFALAATLLAAVVAALLPALRISRLDARIVLQQASGTVGVGPGTGRLSGTLLLVQIALSFCLIFLTGLMARSTLQLHQRSFTTSPERLVGGQVSLVGSRFGDSRERLALLERLSRHLERLPGTESVALTTHLPAGGESRYPLEIEGRPEGQGHGLTVGLAAVSPGYFAALGLPLLQGRGFRASDDADGEPVAVASRSFARRYFPRESALGRRVRLPDTEALASSAPSQTEWRTIVGVVPDLFPADARTGGGRAPALGDGIYVPIAQEVPAVSRILLRTRATAAELAPRIRRAVAALDPELAVLGIDSVAEGIAHQTLRWRLLSGALAGFAASALILAAIGLFGVLALLLSFGARALAVRSALGARKGQIARALVGPILGRAVGGLVLGLALSLAGARLVGSLLVGVRFWDVPSLALAVAAVSASVVAACWGPVRRALRLDPARVLRND